MQILKTLAALMPGTKKRGEAEQRRTDSQLLDSEPAVREEIRKVQERRQDIDAKIALGELTELARERNHLELAALNRAIQSIDAARRRLQDGCGDVKLCAEFKTLARDRRPKLIKGVADAESDVRDLQERFEKAKSVLQSAEETRGEVPPDALAKFDAELQRMKKNFADLDDDLQRAEKNLTTLRAELEQVKTRLAEVKRKMIAA